MGGGRESPDHRPSAMAQTELARRKVFVPKNQYLTLNTVCSVMSVARASRATPTR